MATPCPSEATLVAYATGASAPADRSAIESHMAECADCRVIVSMLAKDSTADPFADTALATEAPLKHEFLEGEIFEDKYRVERLIGAGGMGLVVEATHLGLERRVAIKFMQRETRDEPQAAVRFLREARACANLSSEHVVRVFDNGISSKGEPYLVMELLRGEDLSQLLKREKRISSSQASAWVLEACDAIAEAHRLGVVHRDLKPANLFLAEQKPGERKIKVLDFGVSKLVGEDSIGALTSRSTLVGSPRYMSPEQTQSSARTDARTDIWALGVVLYELVSGTTPFDANNPVGLAAAILTQDVPSLRSRAPEAPASFERIVMRCLQKDPKDRYPSIEALADALRAATKSSTSVRPRARASTILLGAAAVIAGALVMIGAWKIHRDSVAIAAPSPLPASSATSIAASPPLAAASSVTNASAQPAAPTSASVSIAASPSAPIKTSHRSASHASPATAHPSTPPKATNPEDLPGLSDRK
ncbi:MAG: protein kinase domain-containing protein [Polyangiaceae bacterium]